MSRERTGEDLSEKHVFTTGEAATICKVSQQTIIRCFDAGRLGGFRVPGSKFRRIPRDELIRFMRDNQIPLDSLGETLTRVLAVDDDPAILRLYEHALGGDVRYELRSASNGYEAGLLTGTFLPHLMLLDYQLPDTNGELICRRVRENGALRGVKILAVSGVAGPAEIAALRAAGADLFLAKPFTAAALKEAVAQLLPRVDAGGPARSGEVAGRAEGRRAGGR